MKIFVFYSTRLPAAIDDRIGGVLPDLAPNRHIPYRILLPYLEVDIWLRCL